MRIHDEPTREADREDEEDPSNIRFAQAASLLRFEGFVLFNKRGSHRTFHHPDGRLVTVVVPHGKRKTCHSQDIHKLLKVLGL